MLDSIFHICVWFTVASVFIQQVDADKPEFRSFHKDDTQLQEGKAHYNLALRDSQMPRYGSCWKRAIQKLESGCKHLTDDVQSRLALHFANCFLTKAGQPSYPCNEETDISDCLSSMGSNGFTAYTNFFTHTQSMCYFLQTQVWQEETESTVEKLTHNSVKVVQTLEDTNELQNSILEAQRKSLVQQERLLESSSLLGQALDMSKDNVKDMLEEFRLSTSEQRNLIFEVFDRLAKLQNLVLGEVSGFYSLIFYPTALLTVYLLTSTSRTAAARFWLFVVFGCSLALERCMIYITVSDASGYLPADEASKDMYWRIWFIRKLAMVCCMTVLGYFAYTFQDFNRINNAILMQIQRQNLEVKSYLESIGARGMTGVKLLTTDVIDSLEKSIRTEASLHESSSDSDFSYDSDASDMTYVPCLMNNSSVDEETFETAPSRPSSRVPSPDYLALLPIETNIVKKETKPRAARRTITSPGSPSPYNLRSRQSLQPFNSPFEVKESPETFGRLVKQMERITRRNASKIIESVKSKPPSKPSYYSSDDE